jgi:hypothetical protein
MKAWWNQTDLTKRIEISISALGVLVLIAYTVFSALQWAQIRYTNSLTARALDGSGDSLNKTLAKMQGQIDAMNTLATNAGTQATQTTNLAGDTKDLAQTSKDALESVQRAFVFATGLDAIRIEDSGDPTKISSVDFSITWENNGTTPTRNMTSHFSWFTPPSVVPDNFNYPDLGDQKPTPIALGPKTIGHTTPISVPAADITKIMNHEEILYIWGWAHYQDVFPKTKTHITRFCTEITGFQGNPLLSSPNAVSRPITQNCPTYNCYDDECKAQ